MGQNTGQENQAGSERYQASSSKQAITDAIAEPSAAGFAGDVGPGATINQYLPQPGHHSGRRIIEIEDIPSDYWLDSASSSGTPWSEHLGLELGDDDLWEIRNPESLTSAWFGKREKLRPTYLQPTLRRVEAEITAEALDQLATTGSLRNWAKGRAGSWMSANTSSARLSSPTGGEVETDLPEVDDSSSGPNSSTPAQEGKESKDGFQVSIAQLDHGLVKYPASTWGGSLTDVVIDVASPPKPALFIVQVVGISSFLDVYGLGLTVKTMTLLPGETSTISTRTWRATEESKALASSIIDSYDENSSERFADTVMNETTDTATQEKTENWHAEAEAKGSIGIASAKVSGGGGGEYSSSTEEFSKAVDESVAEHAAEASSHRQNEVTSSSESSSSTENEEVVERTIKNINVSRTLNFTFRELNQAYITKTHLKDIRIAFTNGNAGSWREEPISGLRKLIEEVIAPEHVDGVCSDIIKTIAVVHDVGGTPVRILEQVRLDKCGIHYQVRDAEPNDNCYYQPPSADGHFYYRFKRGPLAQEPDEEQSVEGVLMKERKLMMATDSVVAEALLGSEPALDTYSEDLQLESIRGQRLSSDREELAQEIVSSGDAARAEIYATIFGVPASDEESG